MQEVITEKTGRKKDWLLTDESWRRLLAWLDEGADSGGARYLEMRRRLVAYFDRKNCLAPDELADETLNRVARRLVEEGSIETDAPAHYCYITARFVFLEEQRRAALRVAPLEEAKQPPAVNPAPEIEEERARREKMLECLETCAGRLAPEQRELIISYYHGEQRAKIENRRSLAARLGLSANALSIRACRIRDKLQECVERCAGDE
jgi:DNA-directed RNA polymerase specialized sigma24 family protein